MTDDAKARLLADVGPDLRAALARWPAHFVETAAAIAESDTRADVLAELCDLLARNVAHERRRADEAEAQLAAARRSHLVLVPDLNEGA